MRKLVYETQCSRCDRKEMQEASPEDLASPEPEDADSLSFYASLANAGEKHGDALVVQFQDLCTPCKRTIKALLEQVGKKIEGVSPDRKAVEKKASKKPVAKEKTATPSHGQLSDPQTHAQAAGSRTPAAAARA
jgi:hypothetical protein